MNKRVDHYLPPEVAAKFLAVAHRLDMAPGQELFGRGSTPHAMFGIISGRVQVSIFSEEGQRFLAVQLKDGHWFGEVPLLDDEARAFHVEALETTQVAVLSSQAFWGIVNNDPNVLLALTRLVCARYRAAVGWIEEACLKPLPARLATRLLVLTKENDGKSKEIKMSQDTLASQLGVARQTVNKQLKEWAREGMLELRYGSVQLRNIQFLKEIASNKRRIVDAP